MLRILISFLTTFSCISWGFSYEYKLAVCAIFQNEDRFLDEWINYHINQGVEHFWLYNNNSEDNYKEVLAPYIKNGLVDLIDWPSFTANDEWKHFCLVVQPSAYENGINRAKNRAEWLAIIDTDEFILSFERSLIEMLEKYKNEKAIALQWACFGTSNIKYCPSGEMLNLLVWRLSLDHPRNAWYKSIVKPIHVASCKNPHFCNLLDGKEKVLPREEARLNHYWTRDETFLYTVKIPRYEKWGIDGIKILETTKLMNEIFDDSILIRKLLMNNN